MWELALSLNQTVFAGACVVCGIGPSDDDAAVESNLMTCALCMQTSHTDCASRALAQADKARIESTMEFADGICLPACFTRSHPPPSTKRLSYQGPWRGPETTLINSALMFARAMARVHANNET